MALITSSSRRTRLLLTGGTALAVALALPAGAALASTSFAHPAVKARVAGPAVKARIEPRVKARLTTRVTTRVTTPLAPPVTTSVRTRGHSAPQTGSTHAPGRSGSGGSGSPREELGRGWPWGPVLHGRMTLQTRDAGVRRVTVQRGVVTGVGDGTVTVTSADGFVATWTLSPDARFVRRGHLASAADLTLGGRVGLVGTGSEDAPTATLVVLTEPAQPEPTQTEPTQPEPTQTEPTQPEPTETETADAA